jgi:hypothetical protein
VAVVSLFIASVLYVVAAVCTERGVAIPAVNFPALIFTVLHFRLLPPSL